MLESFLFPASMTAGGLLVSSPIIIHLINRMRFKRVRWAAMEFLLKSQKRNRRRLIIEQLILLLLRILLVLLIALIVARFIGVFFGPVQPQTSQHLILLDNTLSMNDQFLENGESKNSFKEAKRLVVDEIAKNAAKASKAQQLKLITATEPQEVRFDQRLNDQSIRDLGARLALIEPTALHVDLLLGVKQARKLFENTPQDQRVLYLVSDFRQTDWSGPNGEALLAELAEMRKADVHIKFVDTADPPRRADEKDSPYHDNLAIVGLRPESRVTARNRMTEFVVTLFNYSLTERKNVQVKVKVNGQDRADSSVPIPVLRPGQKTEARFHVYLDQLGINQISANIDPEDTGLNLDNTRYAVVEVRERVPILLIDGDPANSRKEGGDAYFLHVMFNANRGVAAGYDLVLGVPADLERPNLEQYPSIYLANVRELEDKRLAALENYVRKGGNVAFFMGERINPDFYSKKLYNDGNGIFPVPLADRATPELSAEDKEQRLLANLGDPQYQMFLRNENHSIFKEVFPYKDIFKFLTIERHWPVQRSRWKPTPGKTEELATLPNRQAVDDYKDTTQDLLAKLKTVLEKKDNEKYRTRFTAYHDALRDVLTGKPSHRLSSTIEAMLTDRGQANNPDLPNLAEFWGQTDRDVEELRGRFETLRDTVQYGDPLVVTGTYGKGRTLVWLTSIGRKWSSWAGDFPVSATFPVVMIELQKWLTAGTSDENLLVGQPFGIQLEATAFEDKVRRIYRPEGREKGAAEPPDAKAEPGTQPGDVVSPEQRGKVEQGRLAFSFPDIVKPGMYLFEFTPKTEDTTSDKREQVGFAFNVDTTTESNLLRAGRDALVDKVKNGEKDTGVRFYTSASDQFTDLEQKQRDLSEYPWLFLLFLLVLVLEQALAVHLSFHLKGNEAAMPAGAMRPQNV